MKKFVNFVLTNKLAVWLLTIIITVAGIYSGTRMKMESIPDISIPYLFVMEAYPGATAEKVMDEVSLPMEKSVEGLEDVKAVYSNSSENVAQIQIEYEYGVDLDEKRRELEAALANITLPEGAQVPSVMAINMNMMPVVALSISSTEEDIVNLSSTVEEIILPKIEGIDGVGAATITGQHIEEVHFTFIQEKMEQLGLTENSVKQIIQTNDMSLSLGLKDFEEGEQAVAINGDITTIEQLKELLIPITPSEQNPNPFVKLGDIATIEKIGKVQSISRTNGEAAIAVQITKGQQANTVDVVNEVKDLIEEEEEVIDGLVIDITLDQAEPIEESIFTMLEKALFGGLFAVIIILLFLRDFKSTIISIISIPVSIFMAFLLLNWLEISLNIMTLGAMTVAIGRVIDDSIVVVENIYRRMNLESEKLKGRALIREATIEMFKPILSSTLITVAVFAPLMFVGGMVGELFAPFALTMTFALGASLLVAITIVPALSHFLFRKNLYGEKKKLKAHNEVGKLSSWYKRVLEKVLNQKIITSILAVALLIGSLALTPLIGFSFMGSEQENMVYLTYTPGVGELEEESIKNIEEVEQELMKRDDIESLQLSFNNSDGADMSSTMMGGSNGALLYLTFDQEMENFLEAKEEVEEYVFNVEHSGEWKSQDMSSEMSSNSVSYSLYANDLDDLEEAVSQVENVLKNVENLKDIESDMENPYVEHLLNIDHEHILQYGLTTGQIIGALTTTSSEEVLTTVENNGEAIDVIIQHEAKDATSIDELLETSIPTATGTTMPLSELVSVEEGTTYNTLSRSQGEYYSTVSGTIIGEDISVVTSEADRKVDELDLPGNVRIDITGVSADMNETFTQLGVAMLAAVLIVYLILVVTFSEGLAPFAILFSLPFLVIGSFVGLWIAGETISVSVMMGLLMLIGIVVTNAIVLVDRIIHMEREGMTIREAILEAGATRLRPILMTAIATIGAMLPMAFAGGTGLISKGLAITVIGGLTSSTILTLVIVPIVYEVLSKMFRKNRKEVEEN